MSTVPILLGTAPDPAHGHPVGVDTWRIAVEAIYQSDPLSAPTSYNEGGGTLGWVDVTGPCVGIDVTRGAAHFGGDTEAGICRLEFESKRHELAPWNDTAAALHGYASSFVPGTILRVVAFRPGVEWRPLFTGEVETWNEEWIDDEPIARVVAVDGWARLAQATVEDFDLAGQGGFDDMIDALLARAGASLTGRTLYVGYGGTNWAQYDTYTTRTVEASDGSRSYESTASGLVADIIRTACKTFRLWARYDVYGRLRVGKMYPPAEIILFGNTIDQANASWTETVGGPLTIDVDDVPGGEQRIMQTSTDVDGLVNHVRTSGPPAIPTGGGPLGSGVYETSDTTSINTYGRRTLEETIWRVDGDPVGADAILAARKDLIHRLDRLELDTRNIGEITAGALTLPNLELGIPVTVTYRPPASPIEATYTGYVRSIRHRITPLNGAEVEWTGELGIDSYTLTTTEPDYLVDDTNLVDPSPADYTYLTCDGAVLTA